jgi:hypothetical protein
VGEWVELDLAQELRPGNVKRQIVNWLTHPLTNPCQLDILQLPLGKAKAARFARPGTGITSIGTFPA